MSGLSAEAQYFQQHWQTAAALDGEVEKFARSRVYPMGIFEGQFDVDKLRAFCQALPGGFELRRVRRLSIRD